jgi:hypothetical protein
MYRKEMMSNSPVTSYLNQSVFFPVTGSKDYMSRNMTSEIKESETEELYD